MQIWGHLNLLPRLKPTPLLYLLSAHGRSRACTTEIAAPGLGTSLHSRNARDDSISTLEPATPQPRVGSMPRDNIYQLRKRMQFSEALLGDHAVERDAACPLDEHAERSAENSIAQRLHGEQPTTRCSATLL
jgi:hypothetical protein